MHRSLVPSIVACCTAVLAGPAAAVTLSFSAILTGPAEAPPNASPGTGTALVTIDGVAHTMRVEVSFGGLDGLTTASHIHVIDGPGDANLADTVGPVATTVPSFVGFPLGVTSGSMDQTYDMTSAGSYRAAFITDSGGTTAAAEFQLFDAIIDGRAYLNLHSDAFHAGEIRGFLQAVPEPSTYALLLAGLGALGWAARRRTRLLP